MTDTTHQLPRGFTTAGIHCGVKNNAAKRDLALFVSHVPAVAAGVFTQNRVVGAPVKVSRERVPADNIRAVVINSGNSNACTGDRGIEDASWMTAQVAAELGCEEKQVLVCSTGIIGHFLPREKLAAGFPKVVAELGDTPQHFLEASQGMMTTDTFPKQSSRTVELGGKSISLSGSAKGAAMIAPNMATMLSVVMSDVKISSSDAHELLTNAVNSSFNCVLVEGHTSTSDTVIFLANGTAENTELSDSERETLQNQLTEVCQELAQSIIRDAEGADHFVTIDVRGTHTREDAACIARTVAESALVKTAITGNDPNWGRIVSAAGYSGVPIDEEATTLRVNGILLYESGAPTNFNEEEVSQAMKTGEVHIELSFSYGEAAVRFWTSDLTAEYVRLNSDYST